MDTNSLSRRTQSQNQLVNYADKDDQAARRPRIMSAPDSAKSKTDFSKKVLRKLIMYESKLVRVNCVEPTTISPPKYPRKPTINDIEGEDIMDVAYKNWQRKMTFDRSRPESLVLGKQGTTGKIVEFLTNSFFITSTDNWNLYRYKVEFVPEQNSIDIQRQLLNEHFKFLGVYKFDGTTLISVQKYDEKDFQVILFSNEYAPKRQVIKISFISEIGIEDHEHQYLLKYFLRYSLDTFQASNQITTINYLPHQIYSELQLEHWPGYEITVDTLDGGVLLGVKPFNIIVHMGTVLDFFDECLKNDPLKFLEKFKDSVIGKTVMACHNKRTYIIYDVIESANLYTTLIPNEKNKITCSDYYQKKWKCEMKKHIQPILVSKKILNYSPTNCAEDLVYLVPELCRFTGFTEAMRNNPNLMKVTDSFYQVSRGTLMDVSYAIRQNIENQLSQMETHKWNLKVENTLVKVSGRKLPEEKIYSKKPDQTFKERSGDWTDDVTLGHLPMYDCSSVKKWSVLSPEIHKNIVHTFINRLKLTCSKFAFELPPPEVILMKHDDLHSYFSNLEKIVQGNPSFIFCVLTSTGSNKYNEIQRKLCVDYAVPSQVVSLKTLSNQQLWVCRKLAIQINCKLGGAPWLIDISEKGLMMVGLDVRCDKQNNNILYSGLVATINDKYTKYFSCVEILRNNNEEKWKCFSTSISKALVKYKEKNNTLPTGIVIYKNFVESGQISLIHKDNIAVIKDACKQFYGENLPLAFIVAHKQTSKVLFYCDSKMRDLGNPASGTVIDSLITDPNSYDFFLASVPNYGPNSNSCKAPTHYKVLEDTLNDWSPDKMQILTFRLTYMYYNKTCGIQVPAPVQLAQDLVCFVANTLGAAPNTGLEEVLYFL